MGHELCMFYNLQGNAVDVHECVLSSSELEIMHKTVEPEYTLESSRELKNISRLLSQGLSFNWSYWRKRIITFKRSPMTGLCTKFEKFWKGNTRRATRGAV